MFGFDSIVYAVVLYGTLALALWAFVDAIIRPAAGFVAAGKLTKPGWLAITGIAALVLYWRGPPGFLRRPPALSAGGHLGDARPPGRGPRRGDNHRPGARLQRAGVDGRL